MKKIKNDLELEEAVKNLRSQQPRIIKCSYNTQRALRARVKTFAPPEVVNEFMRMTIHPTDTLPDHIIFLCDERGSTLRMVNLKTIKRVSDLILN